MAAPPDVGSCAEAERRARGVAAREVAGFVGSITTCVCYALFLLWAFVPEEALRAAGVTYYPAKWWALAAPSWLCAAVLYLYIAYGRRVHCARGTAQTAAPDVAGGPRSLNLMTVVAPDSLRAVTDAAAVVLPPAACVPGSAEHAATAAGDLPLSDVCALLYGDAAPAEHAGRDLRTVARNAANRC